jgi:hypothetical protein
MKARQGSIVLVLSCFVIGANYGQAQKPPANTEDSCRHFAQGFYNWYVTEVFRQFKTHNSEESWHAALKHRGDSFSRELARALMQSDAEAKIDGDPVLDFDPILNTQDPAERYIVRTVTFKKGRCWAEVYGVWSRPVPDQNKRSQVVAEMSFTGGRWQIVNFHYPNSTNTDNENLLSILKYRYRRSVSGESMRNKHRQGEWPTQVAPEDEP